MNTSVLKDMINVARAEQQRRASLLADKDAEVADCQQQFEDMPVINELCLMLLVTLRHQGERELVSLVARAGNDGEEITAEEYKTKVQNERGKVRRNGCQAWKEISRVLRLESCGGYAEWEMLRRLANSYKHDPWMKPSEELLQSLRLPVGDTYALLPESDALQKGLAAFAGLGKEATYCDIAERLVDAIGDFLTLAEKGTELSPRPHASFRPRDLGR